MEFQIDQTVFAEELAWVARAVPAKSPTPALNGIMITAANGAIVCTATNGDSTNTAEIGATTAAEGTAVPPGRLLADVVKSMPKKMISVTVDDAAQRMLLVSGRTKFKLPLIPVGTYPKPPEQPPTIGKIDSDEFSRAVSKVAFACAKDGALPVLSTVSATFGADGVVALAATDRYRLAVKTVPWEPSIEDDVTVLLHGKMLTDVLRNPYPGTMQIALDGTGTLFGVTSGFRRSLVSVYDGTYPDYRRLMPKHRSTAVEIDLSDFSDAVKRVRLVADRPTVPLRATFDAGDASFVAGGYGTDAGAAESLPCTVDGDPMTTAFNPEYLSEALHAFSGETVQLVFTEATRPVLLLSPSDPSYQHLLMPVKPVMP